MLLSCAKEGPAEQREFTLEALMPQAETRTTLGEKAAGLYPVLWSEGDCISVNGVLSRPLSASDAGKTRAVFRFAESLQAPYSITYGGAVPAVQAYSEGGVGNFCAPLFAESSQRSFIMRHRSCILRLPLSGSVRVAGISVSGGTPVQLTIPGGGIDVSGGKVFHIALDPGHFENGIIVHVYTASGEKMNLSAFTGERLQAGKVYELPQTQFEANAGTFTAIGSYAELKAFAERVAAGENYLEARLTADIAGDATWSPLEGFSGDFDGGGYRISGLQKALANELVGGIRNLTLDSAISISSKDDIVGDADIYWAGMVANRIYTRGLVSSCVTGGSITYHQWGKVVRVGAVAGYAPRGTVENCVSATEITVIGDGSADIQAGGIMGRAYAANDIVQIRGCRSEGSITLGGQVLSAHVGGIVGHFDPVHTSVLSGNRFSGSLTVDSSAAVSGELYIGGIAGYSIDDFEDCSFSGTIHFKAPATAAQNIGGIAGSVKTGSVAGCSNSGTIIGNGPSADVIRAGGILGWAQNDGSAVTGISVSGCSFSGSIDIDIPSHSTIYAKPVTGLYSTTSHSETDCTVTGTVTVH